MAAFSLEAPTQCQDLDFQLLQNSPVVLYRNHAVFDGDLAWLGSRGYQVVRLDARRWTSPDRFHDDIALAFAFPDYFGRSLDALADCLSDVAVQEYGWQPEATGLVVAILGYETFTELWPDLAGVILDIFADTSRTALLFGGRMMCLVQTDDPQARYDPVGATPVWWNPRESLTARRGPSPE